MAPGRGMGGPGMRRGGPGQGPMIQMQGMMQQMQGMTEQMAEMMKDGAMSPEQQKRMGFDGQHARNDGRPGRGAPGPRDVGADVADDGAHGRDAEAHVGDDGRRAV